MLKDLIRLANHLDQKGLRKEADHLDFIIRKLAALPTAMLVQHTADKIKKDCLGKRFKPNRNEEVLNHAARDLGVSVDDLIRDIKDTPDPWKTLLKKLEQKITELNESLPKR